MFFYERTLEMALAGIDGTALLPTILNTSYVLLLVCFLFSVYQAFARGGDVRLLGVACLKYLAMGLGLVAYAEAFRSLNGMFNQLARFIDSASGANDALGNWISQLGAYWSNNGDSISWNLLTTTLAATLNMILMMIGYILYPVTYTIFSFFYAFYGSVLYVVGPLVLALYPILGIGQMARTYLINLMIFNGWGVIYAVLGALMSAININQVSSLQADQSFLGSFAGLGTSTLLGLVSIFYSLAICLIPFIASRIVRGDVGATMVTMIAAAITTTKVIPAMTAGASSGFSRSLEAPGAPPAAAVPVSHGNASSGYRGFSVAHATGYAAGRTVGAIARRFK